MSGDGLHIHASAPPAGRLLPPGDKSISHRLALLTALADGVSEMRGFLKSEDCLNTLKAMRALGARSEEREDGWIEVTGVGGALRAPAEPLDMGNSGTGMRLLAGLLAGRPLRAELTGDESLRRRPMNRIRIPLEQMGARVTLMGEGGRPPIVIEGGGLRGITYALPVASAQVKSAVLLAGLCAEGATEVIEPRPTRDHTERLLSAMGAPIEVDGLRIRLRGRPRPRIEGRTWSIPGDISSAAFWLAAAAARPGAGVTIENVGLNPRRTAVLNALRRMGADLEVRAVDEPSDHEPVGEVSVRGGSLKAAVIEGEEIPNLIDEIPILACAAARADGVTEIRDAGELRKKESDRIAALCDNLSRAGVDVREREDGLSVHGPADIRPDAVFESFGDHRIAMAMASLAWMAGVSCRIAGTACIATSYPRFINHFQALGGIIEQE